MVSLARWSGDNEQVVQLGFRPPTRPGHVPVFPTHAHPTGTSQGLAGIQSDAIVLTVGIAVPARAVGKNEGNETCKWEVHASASTPRRATCNPHVCVLQVRVQGSTDFSFRLFSRIGLCCLVGIENGWIAVGAELESCSENCGSLRLFRLLRDFPFRHIPSF